MFYLSIFTAYSERNAAITLRKRLPGSYTTVNAAAAAGIAHLQQHARAVGFVIEHEALPAANDCAMQSHTITRAIAARKARQLRNKELV